MRHIVLTGTYCSRNKGDAAMQLAAAQELRRQLGESVRITLASPFPRLDRPLYRRHGVEVVPSQRRRLGRCLLHVALGRALPRALRLTEEADAIAAADLVLDLSGDALSEDYGPHVVLSHLYPIWLALQLGRPVVLCAQTIGPFRRLGPLVRRVLSRVDGITARDAWTERYLRELGVAGPRVRTTADLALLLEPAAPQALAALRARFPAAFRTAPVLGATVSRLLGHSQSLGASARRRRPRLAALAEALEAMMQRHGLCLLLLSHSTGPRPARDDRVLARELAARLGQPDRVYSVEEDLEPAELKGLVAGCRLFCAMRLHSAIAALSAGVPSVVIGYGPKAPGLMEPFGQAGCLLPVAELESDALLERLERTWREREAVRAELLARRDALLELARQNVAFARAWL